MSEDKKYRNITPRIARFIDYYVIDPNGAQAAIKAGYKAKTAKNAASRLLTFVNVREEIDKRQAIVSAKLLVTAEEVIKTLREVRDRCMEHVEAMDKDGNGVGVFLFDANNAIKASEALGKTVGMFVERKKIEVDQQINVYVEGMDE